MLPRRPGLSASTLEAGGTEGSFGACSGGRGTALETLSAQLSPCDPLLLLRCAHRFTPAPKAKKTPPFRRKQNHPVFLPACLKGCLRGTGLHVPLKPCGSSGAHRGRWDRLPYPVGSALSAPCVGPADSQLLLPTHADAALRENSGAPQMCV